MNDLHKELDLIQSVILRMANNSFLIKGWAMTLMSALIAFGKDSILENPNGIYYLVMMIGVLIPFWWLDAFYLRLERAFRKIYERAIQDPKANNRVQFDLNPGEIVKGLPGIWKLMGTEFMKWFYIPFVLIILVGIVLKLISVL